MSLEVQPSADGTVQIVSLSGNLDAALAATLEAPLLGVITGDKNRVVLNLTNLSYVSSPGLRLFLASIKKAQKYNGDVRLAGVQPMVLKVLTVVGFHEIFTMFDTVDDALASFNA